MVLLYWLFIVALNSGQLVFTLDDAYIHLALAENLMQGHYGINLNEYSAPSSSILWPFLLAPFAKLAFANYFILVANTIFTAITLLLFGLMLSPGGTDPASAGDAEKKTLLNVILILLIPACNLIGLIFTGMEHSLQVMLTVAIICGLCRESSSGRLDWWALFAIILAPLVRYECLAISLPAAGYLFFRGHRRQAAVTVIAILTIVAGFSWFLISLGQNPLPNSVRAKSQIAHDKSGSSAFVNFASGIATSRGVLLAVSFLFLLSQMTNLKLEKSERLLCATVSSSIILHFLFGQFGWFCRYEIYIWAAAIALVGFLLKSSLYRQSSNYNLFAKVFFMFTALFLLCFPYLMVLVDIPVAANNIYEQQYQMH